jgi:signal transduction histidine kinase
LPSPSTAEDYARQRLIELFGRASQLRLAGLPLALIGVGLVLFLDPSPWRRVKVGLGFAWVATLSIVEWLRYRRDPADRGAFNLVAMAPVQVGAVVATGGLDSPFVPMLAFLPVLGALVAGRSWHLALTIGIVQVGIWGSLAANLGLFMPDFLPLFFGGGTRSTQSDALLWTRATVLTVVGSMGSIVGLRLRDFVADTLSDLLRLREERLDEQRRHMEDLTRLSAEIAHELKNPLASVRGLADLLVESALPGRAGPRVAVLAGEVGRMQTILDEFLNFSRPLSPLTLDKADLTQIAREVADLHEGVAQSRGLVLRCGGGAVFVRCDRRKIRQILVNLVQNAIEAAPEGSVVDLDATLGPAGATVSVRDLGDGPAVALGPRLFEPGVTTKGQGSGLGLTIARAIARQHGGDVVLLPATGGGARASLTLPLGGPS